MKLPKIKSRKQKFLDLCAQWQHCTRCELSDSRTQVVMGSGNVDSRVLFVAEAPGANEDALGVPFVGKAGDVLDKFLKHAKLDRQKDMFLINVTGCRPWEQGSSGYRKNRPPSSAELEACSPRVQACFEILDPLVVILAGQKARAALFPLSLPSRIRETLIYTVTHPAAFLYGDKRDEATEKTRWKEIAEQVRSVERGKPSGVDWTLVLRGQLRSSTSIGRSSPRKT